MHATYELALQLLEFKNVDLTSRGTYVIRVSASVPQGADGIPYVFSAAPATKATTVNGSIMENPFWPESSPKIDGNYYYSRSFPIRYRHECAVLNEVIQFQIVLPVSAQWLTGEAERTEKATLKVELLHAKAPRKNNITHPNSPSQDRDRDSESDREKPDKEFAREPSYKILCTEFHEVYLGWPLTQAFVPVTFKVPHFVILDAVINCALLNIRNNADQSLGGSNGREEGPQTPPLGHKLLPLPSGSEKKVKASSGSHSQSWSPRSPGVRKVIKGTVGIVSRGSRSNPGTPRGSQSSMKDALACGDGSSDSAHHHSATMEGSYKACLVPLVESLESILGMRSSIQSLSQKKKRKGITSSLFDSKESPEKEGVLGFPLSTKLGEANEVLMGLRLLLGSLGAYNYQNIIREYELEPPFPAPLTPKARETEAAMTHIHILAKLCFLEWSLLSSRLTELPSSACRGMKSKWIAVMRQRWACQTLVHTGMVSPTATGFFEPPLVLSQLEAELEAGAFFKGFREALLQNGASLADFGRVKPAYEDAGSLPMCLCQRYEIGTQGHLGEDISQNISGHNLPSLLKHAEHFSDLSSFFRVDCHDGVRGEEGGEGHLVVLVHGFQGCAQDMRVMKNYINLLFPEITCLCACSNEREPHASLSEMGSKLALEVSSYIEASFPQLVMGRGRLSFIGHSAGSLVIRSALATKSMQSFTPYLDSFISLSSPHLGTHDTNLLVSTATWAMKLWTTSSFLQEVTLDDHAQANETYLYHLSEQPHLALFRTLVLVSVSEDGYVPLYSSRIQVSRSFADRGGSRENAVCEMVRNLLRPVGVQSIYRLHLQIPATHRNVDTLIGRAAHISLLSSPEAVTLLLCTLYGVLR